MAEPNIQLGAFTYPLVRHRLKVWLVLEDCYTKVVQAAEKGEKEVFCATLYSYLSAAFGCQDEELKTCSWHQLAKAFTADHNANRPTIEFPVLRTFKEKKKDLENGWEYEGRTWFVWLHMLAREFGWSIEYVENLELDHAIGLLEEILVNVQLRKEWEYGLSPNCFHYDPNTQKSIFVPMERPPWMHGVPKPVEKVKIKVSDLPVGLVLRWDDTQHAYTKSQ